MDKAELRDRYVEIRSDLSSRYLRAANTKIFESLRSALPWPTITSAHLYRSVAEWNEVDTSQLATWLQHAYPQVRITRGSPDRRIPTPDTQYDVIIVPLLTFDESLHRIGFGGGWYDRFLATQPDSLKVGLAYDAQLAEDVPAQQHDVPLDMIITQSRIFTR